MEKKSKRHKPDENKSIDPNAVQYGPLGRPKSTAYVRLNATMAISFRILPW
jgi:hypothetical protein